MNNDYGISVSADGKTLIIKIPIKNVRKEVEHGADISSLSPKEIIVFRFLRDGLYHKEIADKMNLSLSSVKKHAVAINHKLGFKKRGSLDKYQCEDQLLLKPVLVKARS